MSASRYPRLLRVAAVLLAVLAVAGCTQIIAGRASAGDGVTLGPVDTSGITDSDGGPVDQLAAAALMDVESYWQWTFEDAFGEPWTGLAGGFHSVDTTDPDATPPPCAVTAAEVEGNAYYCEAADVIAWDRAALLPVLQDRFGDAAVVVVLAHEVGHAVHGRLGIDLARQSRDPQDYPTILTEAMADCYAGAFVRWVIDGNAQHIRISRDQLDQALGALVIFRDPVGTAASDVAAHGNGFDRVSSFQDGYEQGPARCADFSMTNRDFTQERFTSLADQARGGNLPLDGLVDALVPDVETYFAGVVQRRGGQWRAPRLLDRQHTPDCSGNQGPTAFCPVQDTVEIDRTGDLARLHAEVGDFATGLLLTTRYGLAVLDALGRPVEGAGAGRAGLCLAGSYSGDLLGRAEGFGLSPGDLDEAVLVLLAFDYGSRDARGSATSTGFERIATFRAGALGGVGDCDIG